MANGYLVVHVAGVNPAPCSVVIRLSVEPAVRPVVAVEPVMGRPAVHGELGVVGHDVVTTTVVSGVPRKAGSRCSLVVNPRVASCVCLC